MTTLNRRTLVQGALATTGALAGPSLLEWASAWAQAGGASSSAAHPVETAGEDLAMLEAPIGHRPRECVARRICRLLHGLQLGGRLRRNTL